MRSGDVEVKRQSLLPKILTVPDGAACLRRPFKSPLPGQQSAHSKELLQKLYARRVFVPWKGGIHRPPLLSLSSNDISSAEDGHEDKEAAKKEAEPEPSLPPGVEPLVLWDPEEDPTRAVEGSVPIIRGLSTEFTVTPHEGGVDSSVTFLFSGISVRP